jgi:small subunit ribosomal protein S9
MTKDETVVDEAVVDGAVVDGAVVDGAVEDDAVVDASPAVENDTLIEYTSESAEALVGTGKSAIEPGAGLGRRKEAVARVRLVPGSGSWTLNGRTLEDYFPNKVHQQLVNSPFALLKLEGKFDVHARIGGGGPSGQAGALRLGVARALNAIDLEANRADLKKAGFLTRDPRAVERKKAGLKKARRAPQYSKR